MKHLHNIRRIDDDPSRTHAWLLRIQRRNYFITRFFSDSTFGGEGKALTAAIEYRDALIIAASPAEHNYWHRTIIRRNNTSGIPGVGHYKKADGTEKWIAFWIDEHGIRKSRTFSVKVYGYQKAKQRAIAVRKHELERIFEIKKSSPLG